MELHEAAALWLEFQPIPGVLFRLNDPVGIQAGEHSGAMGCAIAILRLVPEPLYLVELEPDGREVEALQSQLATL